MKRSFHCAAPGYLAYVPGGGLVTAALADGFSNITNRYTGVFAAAPLLARLEGIALRWLLDLFGLPPAARGVFTSGGSLANFSAIVCAREHGLGESFQDGTIYVSDQVHHSVGKAARLAGFPARALRAVPTGVDGRLLPETVRAMVRQDRASGRRPALLVASAGTVNTGAVDPLDGLAEVAAGEKLWFHVDAAYGGFFQLTERGRRMLVGIERADSITVDPHKGLFLPYGTGALLVRDGEILRRAHGTEGEYLPSMQRLEHAQDSCEYSPELSRSARGLRVWFSVKTFGWRAFRECLDEKLDLAQHAFQVLSREPALEVLAEPDLSILAFRMRDDDEGQSKTHALLERINDSRRVMVSGTTFRGRFLVRYCILNFRTHRERLDEALAITCEAARQLSSATAPADGEGTR